MHIVPELVGNYGFLDGKIAEGDMGILFVAKLPRDRIPLGI